VHVTRKEAIIISYFYCKRLLLTGFYFEKFQPSMLLPAAALTGNSQKRKERRMKWAQQTLRSIQNFWPFSLQSSSRRRSRQSQSYLLALQR